MTPTITATLRLEIVKPVGIEWNQLGETLRALRAPLHRVLNSTVRELEIARPAAEWWAPTAKGIAKEQETASPRTASYRLVSVAWRHEREAAAARVAAGKAYPGDVPISEIEPSSHVVLGVAGEAYARWKKFRKEAWKGTMSLPSYSKHSPIYVSGQGVSIRSEDGNAILSVGLARKKIDLIVRVDGGSAHSALRALLNGEVKVGDAKLVEDNVRGSGHANGGSERKRKWFAMVSYTREVREAASGLTMALHRGVSSFLTCAIQRSKSELRDAYTTVLETGDDVLRHKAAYAARRRSLGQQGRQLGTGAKGHGVDRRHERITRLEDAEANWVRSKCQEVAAHACRLGERHGVTRILLEDWGNPAKDGAPELGEYLEYLVRSFPLAELRTAIEWSAKKRGWSVEIVSTDHNSRDCPACEHRHDRSQSGKFTCENESCKLERPVDVVFAWNMLRRDGKTPGIEEVKREMKLARDRLLGSRSVSP